MTRMLAFVAAPLMTAITVSSACVANSSVAPLQFTIEPTGHADRVQLRFRRAGSRGADSWSSDFRLNELAGLDVAALRRKIWRTVHTGYRDRTPVSFFQKQDQLVGPIFSLSIKGNF